MTLVGALYGIFKKDKPRNFVNIGSFMLVVILLCGINIASSMEMRHKMEKVVVVNLVHLGFPPTGYHPATFGYGGERRHEDVIFSPYSADIKPGYLYSEDDWPDAKVSLYMVASLEHIEGKWYKGELHYQ